MSTEVSCAEHEEGEALIFQSEVHTDSGRSSIPATLAQVNLVLAIDNVITILVLVLQVTRTDGSADNLSWRVIDIILILEEAQALITPDSIEWLTLAILIGISILRIISLGCLGGVVSYVGSYAETEITKLLLVVHSKVETAALVLIKINVRNERRLWIVAEQIARHLIASLQNSVGPLREEVRCIETQSLVEHLCMNRSRNFLAVQVAEFVVATTLRLHS